MGDVVDNLVRPLSSALAGIIWIPGGACRMGAHFAGLVHHTDAEREYAYDRRSKIGKLDKAWDEAMRRAGPSWI
jgi:hypothetical protein